MISKKNSAVNEPQPNLFDLIDAIEFENCLKKYGHLFVPGYQGPYAIQLLEREKWTTKFKNVSDPLLKAHLRGLYWVAVKACWYPGFYIMDIDSPEPGMIDRVIEALRLEDGQHYVMTSPSFKKDGSVHLIVKLTYRDKTPTFKLGYRALMNTVGNLCEVYPQLRRKFRLPLGRDQYLVSYNGRILIIPWWDAIYWLEKLDPVEIESLVFQPPLPFPSEATNEDNPRKWVSLKYARELYEEGLQAFRTRHKSLWILAVACWRENRQPEHAEDNLKRWIRKMHNGLSHTINKGAWRTVDYEIREQVGWIWGRFRRYPDGPNNLEGYLTEADMRWIKEIYYGDIVRQKQLANLICYMRPRAHHDFVYVPRHIWSDEVAGYRTYRELIADLENRGAMDSVHSYRHVEGYPELGYSKKFRLHLPPNDNKPIQHDGRNEHDYYEALRLRLGSVRDMVEFTGAPHYNFYREFARREKEEAEGKSER